LCVGELALGDPSTKVDLAVALEPALAEYLPWVASLDQPAKFGDGLSRPRAEVREPRAPFQIAALLFDRRIVGNPIVRGGVDIDRLVETAAEHVSC